MVKRVFEDINIMRRLLSNAHISAIEQNIQVKLNLRGNQLIIEGDRLDVDLVDNLLSQFYDLIRQGYPVYPSDIEYGIRLLQSDAHINLKDIFLDTIYIVSKKRIITPKTKTQKEYIEAIRHYDIVFGIGPAGTGKTYLAMAMALSSLMRGDVIRIILVRPAVEAGEKLGFLPGDMYEKVNPYLRPLYDALHDMLDFDRATLNDAFVILDEAQNTTSEQMKMFLTRLGYNSKAVVTGDITQVDLPAGVTSGLIETREILKHIRGIKFVYFNETDVIRHRLVKEIIRAYEKVEKEKLKSI